MSDAMYDVKQEQYTTVIREMIRHENDVINHRIMWSLIGQGFIADSLVTVEHKGAFTDCGRVRGLRRNVEKWRISP